MLTSWNNRIVADPALIGGVVAIAGDDLSLDIGGARV
jgi:hypothetical protein